MVMMSFSGLASWRVALLAVRAMIDLAWDEVVFRGCHQKVL